ncbi:hypothetical protein PENTCL1PPCAC_10979 [Pristionchus entomophagus]|uniref:Mothers against decapentaplegic homolog n=1 Tax=Pristionchus entomophagus TaxID=358040 RepID=A0AAV5T0R0_9BILA|nr:hypothetical protein PENTCL1PPCAC_10979 [Pristionchus entomophagus]
MADQQPGSSQGLFSMINFDKMLRIENITKHLQWKQGDEDENWAKKAIDNLMKKLQKHDKSSVMRLEAALKSEGRCPSECVTIPRSLDGRLQISHRKALPHVIYCRVYRWPDLQSHHELKAMDSCQYCYESGQKEICINPYHYSRIDGVGVLPPVLVPRYSEQPPQEEIPPAFLRIQRLEAETSNRMPDNIDVSSGCMKTEGPLKEDLDANYNIPSNLQIVPVEYEDQDNWGTISYYEMNNRVGGQIKVNASAIQIDGFTDPLNNPEKISLGIFSNVNRNSTIENTRRSIGNGVKLTYVRRHGLLFAENLSDAAIFVQSRCCNFARGFHPTTVCKLTNRTSLKIFDLEIFRTLLSHSSQRGFDASYELTKMSIIRLSFVKGWGAEYQRQDVTSTPCWIEIHLHAPLMWLDRVLTQMTPPKVISSMS